MFKKMNWSGQSQKGFTLIETIIAVFVTSLVGLAAMIVTYQVIQVHSQTSNRMVAVKQVENAAFWINQDAQMAQYVQVSSGSGFPLTLSWTEWNNTSHRVVYSIQGNQLKGATPLTTESP